MTRFSANLGFMWTELPLPKAIEAAAQYGFDAVECHFPYQTPVAEVTDALKRTGLKMLGLNTIKAVSQVTTVCAPCPTGFQKHVLQLIRLLTMP